MRRTTRMHSSRYMRSSWVPDPSHCAVADILFTCLPRGPGPKFRTNARWTLEAARATIEPGAGRRSEKIARARRWARVLTSSFESRQHPRYDSSSATRPRAPPDMAAHARCVRRREHVRGSRRVARASSRDGRLHARRSRTTRGARLPLAVRWRERGGRQHLTRRRPRQRRHIPTARVSRGRGIARRSRRADDRILHRARPEHGRGRPLSRPAIASASSSATRPRVEVVAARTTKLVGGVTCWRKNKYASRRRDADSTIGGSSSSPRWR